MDFYFRDQPLQQLETLDKQAKNSGKMAVILGRRRVGKTSLALHFIEKKPSIFLFVEKKAEALLCHSFISEIKRQLSITIHGKVETVKELFQILFEHAKTHPITVVVDEFQEFFNINPSVYSEIQGLWDQYKNQSKIHLIFIGSVYSLMQKIFQNNKEPLFGRADLTIHLKPFSIAELRFILKDVGIKKLSTVFEFYVITGCMPKYLELLLNNQCYDFDSMLDYMLMENSPFLDEGRNQLIEEFGKEYTNYFSILELIARGKTSSSEIQSIIQKNVSAYLDKLESTYHVIEKVKPIDAKPNSKLVKYQFRDNFLKFWFKYFHRNRSAIEIGNFDFIKTKIKQDFSSYSGRLLEKFFVELLAATKKYNRIGSYWQRGYKDEIDIVAINDINKVIVAAEVKRDKKRNSLTRLEHRAANLFKHYPDYTIEYLRLSLEDANQFFEN